MGSHPYPLDNWISNGNTYIKKKKKKTCIDSLPLKKILHTIIQMNYYIHINAYFKQNITKVYVYIIQQTIDLYHIIGGLKYTSTFDVNINFLVGHKHSSNQCENVERH
jgi:hypothetical protein